MMQRPKNSRTVLASRNVLQVPCGLAQRSYNTSTGKYNKLPRVTSWDHESNGVNMSEWGLSFPEKFDGSSNQQETPHQRCTVYSITLCEI
jgi:hypothetical protein